MYNNFIIELTIHNNKALKTHGLKEIQFVLICQSLTLCSSNCLRRNKGRCRNSKRWERYSLSHIEHFLRSKHFFYPLAFIHVSFVSHQNFVHIIRCMLFNIFYPISNIWYLSSQRHNIKHFPTATKNNSFRTVFSLEDTLTILKIWSVLMHTPIVLYMLMCVYHTHTHVSRSYIDVYFNS